MTFKNRVFLQNNREESAIAQNELFFYDNLSIELSRTGIAYLISCKVHFTYLQNLASLFL